MGWRGGEDADAHGAPRQAGRYLLGRVLGAGAMGVVRASFDPLLEREIAVKVVGPRDVAMLRDTDDPTRSRLIGTEGAPSVTSAAIDDARLLDEARALAKVAHPDIVEVFDVGVCEAGVFIAMELVDGGSLREWNADNDPDWRAAIAMLRPAGDALAAAHAVGIVHGDFKPDNVLVAAGSRVKVVDFGLARAIGRVGGHEERGVVFGTPAYLAPECWDGPRRDAAADQFSFFVALCETIVGRRPYPRVRSMSALLLVLQHGPDLRELKALVPPRLQRAAARGLDPDPAQRFASMNDVLAELAAVVEDDRRARGRRFTAAAVLGVALPFAAIGTAAYVRDHFDQEAALAECVAQAESISASWNDEVRTRLEAAMAAAEPRIGADTSTRVIGWLDAYAADWSALDERTCTAAVREPTDLELARRRCFGDRKAAFTALVEVLERADAEVVRNAVAAASELPRVEVCDDPAWLARHDAAPEPDLAERVAAAERLLARAQQLAGAGRGDEALALVDDVDAMAATLAWPALLADVRATRGRALVRLARYEAAATELEAAYFAARELDHDASAAIAVELATVLGHKLARFDDALAWTRHAETALAAIGGAEDETRAQLELALAAVHVRRGEIEQGIAPAEHARDIRRELFGDGHPSVAAAELALGHALAQLSRTEEALACFERARVILERALGPEHIDLATAYHGLGLASSELHRFEDAHAFEQRALAIRRLWLDEDHPDIATALVGIAYADMGLGRFVAAEQGLGRALAIREATFGHEHPAVTATLAVLAQVASQRGECREAVRLLGRAIEITERADAADRRSRVRFRLGLADALRDCHDDAAAQREYEAARTLAEAEPNSFAAELERAHAGIAATALKGG